jgi:ubiquinone/menaquinone biosynthesis C-methylase UbiE
MEISQAVQLIDTALIDWTRPQSWCDLGSGTGTFTMALARLMAPGSTIFAIDQNRKALSGIPDHFDGIEIRKMVGDLRNVSFPLPTQLRPLQARMTSRRHTRRRQALPNQT